MIHPIISQATCTGSVAGTVYAIRAPYINLASAHVYFDSRLENEVWFDTSADKQLRALNTATRYIDRLNFSGSKTNALQFREFPRNGGTIVPDDIKFACCEVAYNLLDGRDPEFESEHVHVGMSSISTVKVNKEVENIPVHILHNIPSSLAWAYIRPYLSDTNTLQILRTK
jgi:hypothetical protein